MFGRARPRAIRPSGLLQLLGVLTFVVGTSGFVSRVPRVKPRLRKLDAVRARNRSGGGGGKANESSGVPRRRRASPSDSVEGGPSLTTLVTSWFHLPPPRPSPSRRASGPTPDGQTRCDTIRADIFRLQASNAELREEVDALRQSMLDRGYTPVDDVFAAATPSSSSSDGVSAPLRQPTKPDRKNKNKPPPSKLPREARLAALVALYGAAVTLGGVLVPIAIGVGAARSLSWLDEGGSLMPKRWRRRYFSGERGQPWRARRGMRWRNMVLSYVPALARTPREEYAGVRAGSVSGGDGDGDAGLLTAEALTDAWDELYPRRQ